MTRAARRQPAGILLVSALAWSLAWILAWRALREVALTVTALTPAAALAVAG